MSSLVHAWLEREASRLPIAHTLFRHVIHRKLTEDQAARYALDYLAGRVDQLESEIRRGHESNARLDGSTAAGETDAWRCRHGVSHVDESYCPQCLAEGQG